MRTLNKYLRSFASKFAHLCRIVPTNILCVYDNGSTLIDSY